MSSLVGGKRRWWKDFEPRPYHLSFDQPVGAQDKTSSQMTSHCLRGFEIYYQLITIRLLDRNIGRPSSPKNLRHHLPTLTVDVGKTRTISKNRTRFRRLRPLED